jgi:chromosome segregation and condensation protein ScpB
VYLPKDIQKTVPEDETLTKKEKEVLSFVAFFQPVSKIEIKENLGKVGISNLVKLEQKGFVQEEGEIYKTTEVFAKYFGVPNNPEEIQMKLAKMDKDD